MEVLFTFRYKDLANFQNIFFFLITKTKKAGQNQKNPLAVRTFGLIYQD